MAMRILEQAWIIAAIAAIPAIALGGACTSTDDIHGTGGQGGGAQSSGQGGASTGAGGMAASSGAGGMAQGAGGASIASSVSSVSSSASGSLDPCAAASDGSHCGGALGGLADHNSVYVCAGGATQSVMACPDGCQNNACVKPPADPCASAQSGNGAYCGGTLAGGDATYLYHCQNGATASKDKCANGCKVNPPGVADACNPAGDPCQGANSGNGLYCGSSLPGGDPNVLYDCQNNATASQTTCAAGCQVNPPGQADACKPNGGGTCCINKPPGVLTQAFTACGNGGSHYGIDYGTAIGTPIYAGISGTVVGSALGFPNCYNNGCTQACYNSFNYVKIKSDCGDPGSAGHDLFVYYLHINDLAPGIANGTHVDQGQLVAHSGNSGCSSGPHIHIETVSVAAGQGASLSTCSSVNPASRYCP